MSLHTLDEMFRLALQVVPTETPCPSRAWSVEKTKSHGVGVGLRVGKM